MPAKPLRIRILLVTACMALALFPAAAFAQTSPASPLTFDVASIRRNTSSSDGRNHIYSSPDDGNFRSVNAPVKMLLEFAFGIPESQIVGAPAWIDSANFDIEAKADPEVSEQMKSLPPAEAKLRKQKMLQALFADRFRLATHSETRELPAYALVVAAKSGPTLKPSKSGGTTINTYRGRLVIDGGADTIQLLAEELAKIVGRPVVNRTGLQGRFDITLRYTPDEGPPPNLNGQPDTSAPSLFTALQEQLGLKLDSRKAPVPVLVIDHIEPPSEN